MTIDERDLLDSFHSLPGWDEFVDEFAVPPATDATVTRALQNVRAAISADASSSLMNPALVKRRRTRRVGFLAVAAAAVTILAVAAPTMTTPVSGPVATASASEFLRHLAATTPTADTTSFRYWRVRLVGASRLEPQSPPPAGHSTTIWRGRSGGMWIAIDGGTTLYQNLPASFDLGHSATVTWKELEQVGDSASGTLKLIVTRVGDSGVFDAAASLLASAPLTQIQRRGLLTALAAQPSVTMTQGVIDTSGRRGVAISMDEGSVTGTIIFSTEGGLLEVRFTANRNLTFASGTVTRGQVVTYQTYMASSGTDTAPGSA